jgi:TetR/AcrR family transcriptional regulator
MTTATRKPTAERSEEIIRAILSIIGQHGVTALSTATLAQEVGVTTGALFRHFPTREAMLEGAVRYAIAHVEQTFPDPDLPPLQRLTEIARNRIKLLGSNPGMAWMLMSEQAYLTLPPDSLDGLKKVAKRSRAFLLEALKDGMACGEIRDDIEPEALLVPVMGTIHALIRMPGVHRSQKKTNPDRILAALLKLLAPSANTKGA